MMSEANEAVQETGGLVCLELELPGLREAIGLEGRMVGVEAARTPALSSRIEVLLTSGFSPLPNDLVDCFPNLRLVVALGAGHNGIDLDHCRARGIRVSSSIGVNAADVADHAVGSLLALVRDIVVGDRLIRAGEWSGPWVMPTRSIGALRVGVVGLGSIGLQIARRMEAFGCSIAWQGPRDKDVPWPRIAAVEDLAQQSDALFVAAPLSDATRGMIGPAVLEALGPQGYLVNVGRGPVVDETALVAALREGRIAGAALDVFEEEPSPAERWRDLPNTVLTPHIAGVTHEAMRGIFDRSGESVRRGLAGEEPEGLVA